MVRIAAERLRDDRSTEFDLERILPGQARAVAHPKICVSTANVSWEGDVEHIGRLRPPTQCSSSSRVRKSRRIERSADNAISSCHWCEQRSTLSGRAEPLAELDHLLGRTHLLEQWASGEVDA